LQPFPGVIEALDALRAAGVGIGVLSDGQSSVQRRKLAALPAIEDRLDVVVMTDELGPGLAKPSPVPFRVACRLLGVSTRDSVYVGNDPRKDFRGARAAGMSTIRTGPVPDEGGNVEIAIGGVDDADAVVDSFASVTTMILGSRGVITSVEAGQRDR
jgi:putative hydrolase of the HAD superfamily